MNNIHTALIIGIVSMMTILLRFLPFIIFGDKRETPKYIVYLGKMLPNAIMGMLVIYCLKDVDVLSINSIIPVIIACLTVIILHIYKRNMLLSIGVSTVLYMILIQFIF